LDEAAIPLLERLVHLSPINQSQRKTQHEIEAEIARLRDRLGRDTAETWENASELDQRVSELLATGRAGSAADLLERAYSSEGRPWTVTDRIATLRLHLGEPARARSVWARASNAPHPAARAARLAVTYLVEGSFDQARKRYQEALIADPHLFEAHYGLAVLELDAGNAQAALAEARRAEGDARSDIAKSAAETIISDVTPYAGPAAAKE
jgi:tetratricopeptide (TPR) repeat protein